MTRTMIGYDSTGAACVKITKGNIDPRTEPDANVGSFYYNSKWAKDAKISLIEGSAATGGTTLYPPGATSTNWTKLTTSLEMYLRTSAIPGAMYALHLYDVKYRRASDNKYVDQGRLFTQGSDDNQGQEPGYRSTKNYSREMWYANIAYQPPGSGNAIGNAAHAQFDAGIIKEHVIWRLPGDNTAIAGGAAQSPVPGQPGIRITKDHFRVSKPGYDVNTATGVQLAIDSSLRALSIISAGDIALPASATISVELNYAVDPTNICDMLLYEDNIIFPMSGYFTEVNAEYWFSGTKLWIQNMTTTPLRCRYMVLANNKLGTSSGPNKVWREFTDNGINVSQFLRPGAADPPRLEDILLDSRWPSVQILAEGYISAVQRSNGGPAANPNGDFYDVPFNGTGVFPFIKYTTVHNTTQGLAIRPPMLRLIENYNNVTRYVSGDCVTCHLTANNARFYSYSGNPTSEVFTSGSGWQFRHEDPLVGIRYYVLGIAV